MLINCTTGKIFFLTMSHISYITNSYYILFLLLILTYKNK